MYLCAWRMLLLLLLLLLLLCVLLYCFWCCSGCYCYLLLFAISVPDGETLLLVH